MKNSFVLFLLLISLFLGSCGRGSNSGKEDFSILDSCNYTDFSVPEISIKQLADSALPYIKNASEVRYLEHYDNDSIPLHSYRGKFSYHPVRIAQQGLYIYDSFQHTGDSTKLVTIKKYLDRLSAMAFKYDSCLFYPYSFDFYLHSNPDEPMKAPWYSGMAQGQALSLICRYYQHSGDSTYLEMAHKTFKSFNRIKGKKHQPWISCVDNEKNLWLEEYPQPEPCFTLNGMIFGIYGVYEYYLLTRSEEADKILKASIGTIRKNIESFRNENDLSYYCLKHQVKSAAYHDVHIEQLKMLSKITGDEYFKEMAIKFETDSDEMSEEAKN